MAQDKYPTAPLENILPFTMPTPQYDTTAHDPSNQLAPAQLLRRLSPHASNTSNSGKRGSTRVTKLRSAENSPHNVQRRRTTAAHTTRGYPRAPQDNPYLTREQQLWNYYNSRKALLEVRPFSWHPGSVPVQVPNMSMPHHDPAMGNAITGLESLAVSETTPTVQQSIHDAFAMGYGYPVNTPAQPYEQQTAPSQGLYQANELDCQTMFPLYPSYDSSEPIHDYHLGQATTYQPQSCLPPNQWPQPCMSDSSALDTTCRTVTLPLVQPVPKASQHAESEDLPDVPKEEEDELVGIGLYDNEDGNYVSTLNSTVSDHPKGRYLGKDLKLEETWQPPNQEDDGGESSDEPEEAEEEPPVEGGDPGENQTAWYPTYGDLSDQSFFFNDDIETYGVEDQYASCLALNPTLQPDQVKAQPAGSGNFLWF